MKLKYPPPNPVNYDVYENLFTQRGGAYDPLPQNSRNLGTKQYLWEYGTGKIATRPPVIMVLQLDGASGYFEG